MIRGLTILAATAAVAGALAAASAPALAQQQPFRCPAAGTVVERTNGPNLVFTSPDPADPLVCRGRHGQRLFLGYWDAQSPAVTAGRAELARVFGGAASPGATTRPISFFASGTYMDSVRIEETWRMVGVEPVQVPAGSFEALRVERHMSVPFSTYSFTEAVWLDRRTGAPVKASVSHTNAVMAPSVTNWSATEVNAPSSQSAR